MYTITVISEIVLQETTIDDAYEIVEYNYADPIVINIKQDGKNVWVKFKYKSIIHEP